MSDICLKELYKAKSLESLNKQVNIIPTGPPKMLIKSANMVLSKAELSDKEKDEELAYIFFMRYFGVVKAIQEHADYALHKKYYESMLNSKNFKNILARAEELSQSLERRYKILAISEKEKNAQKVSPTLPHSNLMPDVAVAKLEPNNATMSSSKKMAGEGFIRCEKLYALMQERASSFLVVDIRPREDLNRSAMKTAWRVNIPEEILLPGLTADKAGRNLCQSDRPLWQKRGTYDYVIICDWFGDRNRNWNFVSIILDAMNKWDPGNRYRSEPMVLEGGYELFSLKYPTQVTNPTLVSAPRKQLQATKLPDILNFEYPDLENSLNKVEKPVLNDERFESKDLPNIASKPSIPREDPPNDVSQPSIPCRSLKPLELLESIKMKNQGYEKENRVIEEYIKAEKETIEKLEEVVESEKAVEVEQDEVELKALLLRKEQLERELGQNKNRVVEMEKKCSYWKKQHDDMVSWMSQLMSEQGSTIANKTGETSKIENKEREDLKASKDKRRALLEEVEVMRQKRKSKERAMKQLNQSRRTEQNITRPLGNQVRPNPDKVIENRPIQFNNEWSINSKLDSQAKFRTSTEPLHHQPFRSSNIKRSHSALNLSLLDGEEETSKELPSFDRALKPLHSARRRSVNAARHRNFEPKLGSVGPTKTGLKNLGNTCYMNSIVQCLNNSHPFAKYFMEGQYSEDINGKSQQHGEVAEEFGAVVEALWCGQYRSIALWDLKAVVGRCHAPFLGCDQHDAHEFLIKLLDWLHDDLNLVTEKRAPMEEQNHEDVSDAVAASRVMAGLKIRDWSVVRRVFYGLHRSVVVCRTCSFRSLVFEPFSVLTLAFADASAKFSLKEMLNDYYREQEIEYKCSKCGRMRSCQRKLDIWKLPPVLIIHLNRFEHDVLTKKKQNFVDFPVSNLDLSSYSPNSDGCGAFDLFAVSNHYGTMDGGHYTAFCKSPHKNWLKFDDHEVYEYNHEALKTSAAYLLFYEAAHLKSAL